MIRIIRYKIVFLVIAIGILAGLGTVARALYQQSEEPASQPKLISPEQAAETVKKFSNVTDIKKVSIDPNDPFYKENPTYEITNKDDDRIFWVNGKTGELDGIIGKVDATSVDKSKLPLTKEAAIRRASDYVSTLYDNFDELKLTQVILNDNKKSYELMWQKIDENGAELPNQAWINIDFTTGEMGGYVAKNDETTISTKPQISKEEAIENAKLGLRSTTEIIGTDLKVLKKRQGEQRLAWLVEYYDDSTGLIATDYIAIDAITGENITKQL